MSLYYELCISNHIWKNAQYNLFRIPCPVAHTHSTFSLLFLIEQLLMRSALAPDTQLAIASLLFPLWRETHVSVSLWEVFLSVFTLKLQPSLFLFWWHNYSTFNNRTSEGHFSCWLRGPSANPAEINQTKTPCNSYTKISWRIIRTQCAQDQETRVSAPQLVPSRWNLWYNLSPVAF